MKIYARAAVAGVEVTGDSGAAAADLPVTGCTPSNRIRVMLVEIWFRSTL